MIIFVDFSNRKKDWFNPLVEFIFIFYCFRTPYIVDQKIENYLKIVLLIGGSSVERQVSYSSGLAILASLKNKGHSITVIDPAIDLQACDDDYLKSKRYKSEPFSDHHRPEHIDKLDRHLQRIKNELKPDIVFIGLHGGYGEDGTVQKKNG